MAVYGYTRVSTSSQAEDGESLAVQRTIIEGYAQSEGFTIDKFFVERGVSGSKPLGERPQGHSLLTQLEAGDVIMATKLDRMFRSAVDALTILDEMKAKGVSLYLKDLGGDVTGNGIAKLVFTILSAVAEAERDRIRERIRDVKSDQKRRGRHLGGSRPFGFDVGGDGTLVLNKPEQKAIRLAVKLHKQGESLRSISAKINDKLALKVSHVSVGRIVKDHGSSA